MASSNNVLLDSTLVFEALSCNSNDYSYIWNYQTDTYLISENLSNDFHIQQRGDHFVDVWQAFVHKRDLERVKEQIHASFLTKKKKLHIEYQVTNPFGKTIWLSDKAVIHYNKETNEPELIIGIMRNVDYDGDVDPITGLLMHTKCQYLYELQQKHSKEPYGALMLLGIDDFASVNTLNNHSFGDQVLRASSQALLTMLPDGVNLYRYDGDQLLIFANKYGTEQMLQLYEKIKAYTSTSHMIQGIPYRFTISAGISGYPQHGSTWLDLEKATSIALKIAKDTGKNKCVVFSNQLLVEKLYEQSLGRYLADSVEQDFHGFHVLFQPVCHTQTLKVKGAEILLRYTDPHGDLIEPEQFIPILEQTHLINVVGLWVLEQAIKACHSWSSYLDEFVINVNVSYIQLQDISFVDKIEALLKQYNVDICHLVLEITESKFIVNSEEISYTLQRLQALHLQIAMDDFGTGYSSLARLSQFNVDVVKIDRSFVQSLHKSKYNHDFIDSVVRLCHNVGLKVCVEGVETKEELASICVLHADYIQGFYVSRPIEESLFISKFLLQPHINDDLIVPPDIQLRYDHVIADKDVLSAMMQASPLGLTFWNQNNEIIACNSEILHLLQAPNFEEFKQHFLQFSPLVQPDGSLSSVKFREIIQNAFKGEKVRCFWEHQTAQNETIPSEVTVVRIPYMQDFIVASYTRDMREQKLMEDKIENFNARLAAILDSSPLCLNLWNKQFQNIMCNKAAVSLFDLDSPQAYLDNFFKLSPKYQPDGELSSEIALHHITKAFETGYQQFVWMHCKLNGEEIPAEITLIKLEGLDEEGNELVAGYTRDLRKQRLMEEKIELFNVRLKAILDSSPTCLNLWNRKFENIMCNTAAVTLFDLNNKDEYLHRFFELSPKYQPNGMLSSDQAANYITNAFATGYQQFVWTHRKLDGELIPSEITLVKIQGLDEDGGDLVAGYTRDIRSQLEAQHVQQTITNRIRAVLDSSPLASILWSTELEIIDCNQVALKLFAVKDKQELIDGFDSFIPELQPDGESSIIKKAAIFEEIAKTSSLIFEWVYLNKELEEVPCEVTMVKIPLEKENIIVAYSRDLRELHQTLELNDRLSKMAYYDLLTGVYSRARFSERLEVLFAQEPSKSLALVLFDIDFFKLVNDTFGHAAGDSVLKRVAKMIEKLLPNNSILGRYGGDEFVILMKQTNKVELQRTMKLCVESISNATFEFQGHIFTTSISMGGSFKTENDINEHQLMARCDKALYESKERGRNRYTIL